MRLDSSLVRCTISAARELRTEPIGAPDIRRFQRSLTNSDLIGDRDEALTPW
jgi:hypothetical protein